MRSLGWALVQYDLSKVKKLEDTYGGEAMGRHKEDPPGLRKQLSYSLWTCRKMKVVLGMQFVVITVPVSVIFLTDLQIFY